MKMFDLSLLPSVTLSRISLGVSLRRSTMKRYATFKVAFRLSHLRIRSLPAADE
jgi:hypothetical protein